MPPGHPVQMNALKNEPYGRRVHISSLIGHRMRPVLTVFASLMFFALLAPVAPALPAESLDKGMMFGGQWSDVNNTTTDLSNLTDLRAVVEVYTATWCENCVDVEHALDEVQEAGVLTQYHIHRAIGETQDPFGSEAIDARWNSKYGQNAPPAVVFNGSMKKLGSVADDATLVDEFTGLANTDLALGVGTTSFGWAPTTANSGTVTWNLDIGSSHLENSTLNVTAWIVEAHAEFEEGSNGLGTYPHIVLDIVSLGNELQGSVAIQIPEANDGDDLQVHLLYEIVPIVEEPTDDLKVEEPKDSESVPFLTTVTTAIILLGAAMTHKVKINQKDRRDVQ